MKAGARSTGRCKTSLLPGERGRRQGSPVTLLSSSFLAPAGQAPAAFAAHPDIAAQEEKPGTGQHRQRSRKQAGQPASVQPFHRRAALVVMERGVLITGSSVSLILASPCTRQFPTRMAPVSMPAWRAAGPELRVVRARKREEKKEVVPMKKKEVIAIAAVVILALAGGARSVTAGARQACFNQGRPQCRSQCRNQAGLGQIRGQVREYSG